MYSYTINHTHGTADTIDQVRDHVRTALTADAQTGSTTRWAITTPRQLTHTGSSTPGRPDDDQDLIEELLDTLWDNLTFEASR